MTNIDVNKLDFEELEVRMLGSTCLEAEKLVNGSRAEQYGDQDKNFKDIAKMASMLTGKDLDKFDIVKIMLAVKLMRESFKHKDDNLVDLCGYADILNYLYSLPKES